jgi:hypothetical protein
MSRKKPGGGRVTPKGSQPATPSKRPGPDGAAGPDERPGFPAQGADRFTGKGRTFGGPAGPTRSGHHRGNR